MKYIIEIENEYIKDWVNETPMRKELCMPISVPNRHRTYHVSTGFKLEPYTEPDRKAIEDAVWDFSMKTDFAWISEVGDKPLGDYSYQEAKAKYDAWRAERDEIRVGDEVEENTGLWKGVVVGFDESGDLVIMDRSGKSCGGYKAKYFKKTGRHFPEVDELLKVLSESMEGSDD